MRKLLFTIIMLAMAGLIGKADVKYEILSEPLRTAAAWIDPMWGYGETIEPTVNIKGIEYTVTTVKKNPGFHYDTVERRYEHCANYVCIPATVKYIETKAFCGFFIGKYIFESDEPLEKVGDYAFAFNGIPLEWFNLNVLPNDPDRLGKAIFCVTTIDTPIGGSQLTVIPAEMFSCTDIPHFDFSPNLERVGESAFYGCKMYEHITLPDNVILDKRAFHRSYLKGITLGDNVTVGPEAFRENVWVDSIKLGKNCMLDSCAFGPNYLVHELRIPEGTTLGTGTFNAFVGLETVHIAEDVVFAGEKCFSDKCPSATGIFPHEFWEVEPKPLTVYYYTTSPQYTEADQFEDLTYEEGCLYVYPEGVEAARTTYPWSRFKTILPMDPVVGIKEIETGVPITDNSTEEVYTLNGVRVGTSTEDLAPGVYILRQGPKTRKVVIK